MGEIIASSPPTTREAVVSAGIERLVNQIFDRFSDDLAVYATDPRRDREYSGGTTLTADNEGVIWEDGAYGKMSLEVTDEDCRQKVWRAFMSDDVVRLGMRRPETSHHDLIHNANQLEERYTGAAATLMLKVLRDRYPKYETDWREPLMERGDISSYPENWWGERHKVGIELKIGYNDAWAPDHPALWRFGMSLQTRFDKPSPQREIHSHFFGLVRSTDVRDFEADQKIVRVAGLRDVLRMTDLFEVAGDIRPHVTPIGQLLKSHTAIKEIVKDFFEKQEKPATNSAAVE